MTFMLAAMLAVLLDARMASRKLIRPSAPGLVVRAVMLPVLPSTTSLTVETVIDPAAYAGCVSAEASSARAIARQNARHATGGRSRRDRCCGVSTPICIRLFFIASSTPYGNE